MKTIAIVGGGFCGAVTAVNLARLNVGAPVRVVLINSGYRVGRGVAYSTPHPEHVLNVPARDMSAFPDHPTHFVDWLRTRAEVALVPLTRLREHFLPRRLYGAYLEVLLASALRPREETSTSVEVVEDEAVDIVPAAQRALIALKSGRSVTADQVLLATGNLAPAELAAVAPVRGHRAHCANPWRDWSAQVPEESADILLVGTGLTMIDAFLTLRSRGWKGMIYAVSRNGLLPERHGHRSADAFSFPEQPWRLGLNNLAALAEERCGRLRSLNKSPALVADRLRPFGQRIWQEFSLAEKREFCQRYRTRWTVLRHRIPAHVAQEIDDAQAGRKFRLLRGSLVEAQPAGACIRVRIASDAKEQAELTVGLLVNCTGPRESVAAAPGDLFPNLIRRGLVRPDEMDMGVAVTRDFATVDREGRSSSFLFAIGPLLKGTLWETTAVPELREQTFRVAKILLEPSRERPGAKSPSLEPIPLRRPISGSCSGRE